MSRTKKLVAAGLTVGLTLGLAGAAFAYFTSSGSGTGNATVGSASEWTVAQTGTTGTMYPGIGQSTITFTLTNTGSGAQAIDNSGELTAVVDQDGSGNIQQGSPATSVTGCQQSWFNIVSITPGDPYMTSIASGDTETVAVVVSMSDSGTSQDLCQGASPNVTLSVTA